VIGTDHTGSCKSKYHTIKTSIRSKFQKVKCTRRNEHGTNASTVIRYSVNYTTGISLTYIWHIWYKQKKHERMLKNKNVKYFYFFPLLRSSAKVHLNVLFCVKLQFSIQCAYHYAGHQI
jgi:hypothetical protein